MAICSMPGLTTRCIGSTVTASARQGLWLLADRGRSAFRRYDDAG
jgi:hypothetical protein